MNYYMAPLEGITGYIYRNAYSTYFPHFDKYFTPFLSRIIQLSSNEELDYSPFSQLSWEYLNTPL